MNLNDNSKKKDLELNKHLIKGLEHLKKEALQTEKKIRVDIKNHSTSCETEIEKFEDKLKYYMIDLKQNKIYNYDTGIEESMKSINQIEEDIQIFKKELADF